MSSFYVEFLLLNQDAIRSSLEAENDDNTVTFDFENDVFYDLLVVEDEIKRLEKLNLLTPIEIKIISLVNDGITRPSDLERCLGIPRQSITRLIKQFSSKIGFFLGDYFTDEGFYKKMCDKYSLDGEAEQILIETVFGSDYE